MSNDDELGQIESDAAASAIPLIPMDADRYADWLGGQPETSRAWLEAIGFEPKEGKLALLPAENGELAAALIGTDAELSFWSFGDLSTRLPANTFRIKGELTDQQATDAALAWSLGSYRFERYTTGTAETETDKPRPKLVLPENADGDIVAGLTAAMFLSRDLINTPAADMGPPELAEAAKTLAAQHGATCKVLVGEELLANNYPSIHAVGRAAAKAPRLIDLTWGDDKAPKLTLVGKGVCFDTGGLDLKGAAGMLKMKKDMGGAAAMLGLASAVMSTGLPVRLRLLIPAVENAVDGSAYRPGDILTTRKGITVEIGNTDAEGRVVLCDALAEGDGEEPDLMIDCATLTGAARVALGPDLPALFCDDDDVAAAICGHGEAVRDHLWRLPLFAGYKKKLDSPVADMNNVSSGAFAGAITAALYLQSFVDKTNVWAHIDSYGWNDDNRPGRPKGGEALALRALFAMLRERYPA